MARTLPLQKSCIRAREFLAVGHLSFPNATSGRNPLGRYSQCSISIYLNPNLTVAHCFSAVFLAKHNANTTKGFPIPTFYVESPMECPNKLVKNSINFRTLNDEKIALIYGVLMKQKEGFLRPSLCEYQRKEL